LFIDMK